MSTHISRRKVVKGVAWATPVIAASSVVPAYAASKPDCTVSEKPYMDISADMYNRREETEYLYARHTYIKVRFELVGGAGGGSFDRSSPGGSGAKVTGVVEVPGPASIELIAGGGGRVDVRGYGPTLDEYRSEGFQGGQGFGNGGGVPNTRIPDDVMKKLSERWAWAADWDHGPHPKFPMEEVYGCSGGGSTALLINGEVIAVAGGGGGGTTRATMFTTEPDPDHFPGIVDVRMTGPENQAHPPVRSVGGSGERARGGDATIGREYYAQDPSIQLTVEGGKGGGNGIGGAGGAKPTVLTGTPNDVFSFDSQNNQILYSSSTAGNPGTNGLQGNGGDGVMSVSYQLDNHSLYGGEYETLKLPDGTHKYLSYYQVAPYFNGAQIIVSGGGGGGYGGGGSGAALSQSAITIAQKWNNNPQGIRQSVSSAQVAGGGGAGGSYLAPSVIEGEISLSNNADNYSEYGTGGTATVYLCEVPW